MRGAFLVLAALLLVGCAAGPGVARAPVEDRGAPTRGARPPATGVVNAPAPRPAETERRQSVPEPERPEAVPDPAWVPAPLAPVPLPAPPPGAPAPEVAARPLPQAPAAPPTVGAPPAPRPPAPVAAPPALPTPPATHPAVAALVSQSNQQLRAGDPDLAAASLERALRIEPENPWLWHHLAVVRLLQRQDEQAVQIAARSNALTSDRVLQARNWRAMAQAQERLGRPAAARSAAARAQALDAGG